MMPELAKIALVAGMIGVWFAIVGWIAESLISDKHLGAKDFAAGVCCGGIGAFVVGGLVFLGQMIVSLVQMWWG